jgi:hypothetical protein
MNLFSRFKNAIAISLLISLVPAQAQAFWGLDNVWSSIKNNVTSVSSTVGSALSPVTSRIGSLYSSVANTVKENKAAACIITLSAGIAIYYAYKYWQKPVKPAHKDTPKKSHSARSLTYGEYRSAKTPGFRQELSSSKPTVTPSVSSVGKAINGEPAPTATPVAAKSNIPYASDALLAKQAEKLKYIEPRKKKKKKIMLSDLATNLAAPVAAPTTAAQTKAADETAQKNSAEEDAWLKKLTHAQSIVDSLACKPSLVENELKELREIGTQAEDVLLRCSATLFDDLHAMYAHMFNQAKMDKQSVYKRLHYKDNETGIKQTWEQTLKAYGDEWDAKDLLRNVGGSGHDVQLDCIGFIIRTKYAKQNFDHFLQGRGTTDALQINNAEIKKMLEALCESTLKVLEKSQKSD